MVENVTPKQTYAALAGLTANAQLVRCAGRMPSGSMSAFRTCARSASRRFSGVLAVFFRAAM